MKLYKNDVTLVYLIFFMGFYLKTYIFMNWQHQLHSIKIILKLTFEAWFYFFGKLDLKTFSVGSFSESNLVCC